MLSNSEADNFKDCVVVGGGPVGILASILLSRKYKNVTVIEQSNVLGGLLNSIQDDKGNYYDIGTHIPNKINIKDLDGILFGDEKKREESWIKFDRLPTQNYFNGVWNRASSLIDARSLSKEKYNKGIVEFFQANEQFSNEDNLSKITTERYGPTFSQAIFEPIIKKLYGIESNRLETQGISLDYFGLARLILLTPKVTNKLKQIEFFDKKIGYHENLSTELLHYYPKSEKGCGYWIDSLVDKAKKKGVIFKLNTTVDKINLGNKKISSIEAHRIGNIKCDLLVWTIPPILALKASGIDINSRPPTLRTTSIFHYSIDKELLIKDALYVWCMDPKYKSFRITLYPNLNPHKQKNNYTISSEILSDSSESKKLSAELIFKELISLGIVNNKSKILSNVEQVLHNTFPVPEIGFMKNVNNISEKIQNEMSNLLLFGRSTGKTWFMTDVFRDVYNRIEKINN